MRKQIHYQPTVNFNYDYSLWLTIINHQNRVSQKLKSRFSISLYLNNGFNKQIIFINYFNFQFYYYQIIVLYNYYKFYL